MKFIYITLLLSFFNILNAQEETDAMLFGDVKSDGEHLPYVNIIVKGTTIGTASDYTGHFMLTNLPIGELTIQASSIGYKTQEKKIVTEKGKTVELYFDLIPDFIMSEQIVISVDRNETRKKDAPIIVNSLSPIILEAVDAKTLADGISFSPGLRIESDCQNCGYTQVRMNGLDGPYSQILINSRPIFSGLAGVYGLEQIPVNMIERIEIVRGGGSALFGGNAIAGTINIITKDPIDNSFSVGINTGAIGVGLDNSGKLATDNNVNFNTSIVSDDLKTGVFIFGIKRNKTFFDANDDSFSELPEMNNLTAGFRAYHKPGKRDRIGFEFNTVNEDRRGGNNFDMLPHEADIAEMIKTKSNSGNLSYELFLDDNGDNKLSLYASAQQIKRDSYYGANKDPDAYGYTEGLTANIGVQLISKFERAIFAPSTLTVGVENISDDLNDVKLGANGNSNILIADQQMNNIGIYAQNSWSVEKLKFIIGLRYDIVDVNDKISRDSESDFSGNVLNPRLNILYSFSENFQLRASAATGFRAPQIFDEDLHIEANGARTIIHTNDENLEMERSQSYTLSTTIEEHFGRTQVELVLEGFYTNLNNAFNTEYESLDTNGTLLSVRKNAEGSTVVAGTNIEINIAPSQKLYVQIGGTIQMSEYDNAQQWGADSLNISKQILRTPSNYAYLVLNWKPLKKFTTSISGNYTGSMYVPHLAGGNDKNGNLIEKETLVKTGLFFDMNLKLGYKFSLTKEVTLEFTTGVKNIFNSFQSDFDTGINRDAGYVYGPINPRTIFFSAVISR